LVVISKHIDRILDKNIKVIYALNKMRKKKLTIKQLERIIELNDKGLNLREIGKLMGLSHETIRKLLARYKKVGKIIN